MLIAALIATVGLIISMGFFMMGSLPLLVLQHDTPLDGRFIRRFFEVYVKFAVFGAVGACLSYALWGRAGFALGAAGIGALVLFLRRRVLPAMERLGARIQSMDGSAIPAFRKLHSSVLLLNLVQLVALVWGVTQVSL